MIASALEDLAQALLEEGTPLPVLRNARDRPKVNAAWREKAAWIRFS
jgi:hypothetical protein